MKLDIDFVRSQFPALAGEWVFFENAGGTQALKKVTDAITDYLLYTNVQLGASYEVSKKADMRVASGVAAGMEFINAGEKCEVIMGSSTTQLVKMISTVLGEVFNAGNGDEIIVTNCDHEANIGPWRNLEKRGFIIKEWKLNQETSELDLEDLGKLMTGKTRLVALTNTSNVLGTINPIKKIASFVHARGAMICVDGVAYAPHRRVNVRDLDVDFYVFSFYKVYGPHYSLLYGKKSILEKLPGVNHFFLEDQIPYKFQPGHVNFELAYSITGIKDYFMELGGRHSNGKECTTLQSALDIAYDCIAEHEEILAARFLDFLNSKKNVRIIGKNIPDRSVRVPTFSFTVEGKTSDSIPVQVDNHKIAIRSGDFYARRLIDDLGLSSRGGVIRVSMVHYNTIDEVERLIAVLDRLI